MRGASGGQREREWGEEARGGEGDGSLGREELIKERNYWKEYSK